MKIDPEIFDNCDVFPDLEQVTRLSDFTPPTEPPTNYEELVKLLWRIQSLQDMVEPIARAYFQTRFKDNYEEKPDRGYWIDNDWSFERIESIDGAGEAATISVIFVRRAHVYEYGIRLKNQTITVPISLIFESDERATIEKAAADLRVEQEEERREAAERKAVRDKADAEARERRDQKEYKRLRAKFGGGDSK